ncbi:MAG: hypothetical protein WBW80_18545 [Acidimicrobiales bacterium]
MPFWVLQLAELLAAVAFADLSLHVDHGQLLVGGTVAFALLAVTAQGPLGLVRVVPRRLHVHIACVVSVLFALAPILPQARPDASGIIIVEFGAVGLFRLATLTRTDVTVRVPKHPGDRAFRDPQPNAPAVDPAEPAALGPEPASTSEVAARWLGNRTSAAAQQASIAAQAAALTAEKHAPAARAQAGRALRSAGRLTGRMARSSGSRLSAPGSSGPGSTAPGSSGSGSPAPDSPGTSRVAEVSETSATPERRTPSTHQDPDGTTTRSDGSRPTG